jgi:hypothetical protein
MKIKESESYLRKRIKEFMEVDMEERKVRPLKKILSKKHRKMRVKREKRRVFD